MWRRREKVSAAGRLIWSLTAAPRAGVPPVYLETRLPIKCFAAPALACVAPALATNRPRSRIIRAPGYAEIPSEIAITKAAQLLAFNVTDLAMPKTIDYRIALWEIAGH